MAGAQFRGLPVAPPAVSDLLDPSGNEAGDVAQQFIQQCDEGDFDLPLPGAGRTSGRFAALRRIGRGELAVARLGEGHADALAILHEAGIPPPSASRLGVWAAGPLDGVTAVRDGAGWRLEGIRRWCSGALLLSHALVTAAAPDGPRLFVVPVRDPGVLPDPSTWPAVGMAGSGTFDVAFDDVRVDEAAAVGGPDFYLTRPGFWVGGAGVAAVWLGGADAVAAVIAQRAAGNPHALAHLGAVHGRLAGLSLLLEDTAREIDRLLGESLGKGGGGSLQLVARTLRAEVEAGATEILDRTGRATGAGPLGHDGAHARRVADLTVYLRQSHGERDLEALGELVRLRSTDRGSS